jgi:hypothetical protein
MDMIKVNLLETFELEFLSEDFMWMTFYAPLKDGGRVLLKVIVESLDDPLLPNTYNLAFGPFDSSGSVDDTARVFHNDPDKVFSTILLFCLAFLQTNTDLQIGLDGSDDSRAYLYHRMFHTNREYLNDYFEAIGVDWYLKVLRNGDFETDSNGQIFLRPKPESFNYSRSPKDLYRYYMFRLNNREQIKDLNLTYGPTRTTETR